MIQKVLSVETSCDDTSVAIVAADGNVLELISANQDQAHRPFGGIVPEIAGRNHSIILLALIDEVLKKSNHQWQDIDGLVVTNRPGLIGSLIVGLVTVKSLSQAKKIPFLGVNHLEGHILAPFLADKNYHSDFSFDEPFIALAVSGGHTSIYHVKAFGEYEILGSTLDDAAGEAFDKFGKMLGLGFPGGVKVDQLSKDGDPQAFDFPRGMIKEENYLMSFSGLKASGQRLLESLSAETKQERMKDLCASYQEAIVDVLIAKLNRAVTKLKINRVVITGGVSANSRLRSRAAEWANSKKVLLQIPPLKYCTDNAAMTGFAGILRMNRGEQSELSLGPSPNSYDRDFINVSGS